MLLPIFERTAIAQQPEASPKITLEVLADYLALHVRGSGPKGAMDWRYSVTLRTFAKPSAQRPFPEPLAEDGSFHFDIPLSQSGWSAFTVRANLDGKELIAIARPASREFKMLTPMRINLLPEKEAEPWREYMLASARRAGREHETLAKECWDLKKATPDVPVDAKAEFEMRSDVPAEWYRSPNAVKLADVVLSFQTPTGAWSKAIDYDRGPRTPGMQWTINPTNPWHYCGTLDNRSTTEQTKFLATVFGAIGREDLKMGSLRGLNWLLIAQFPNGGWPQNYPVESGYHEAITLNDGAMLHAMELLLSASKNERPFEFLDQDVRRLAAAAFDRAVACVLAMQVKVNGNPTVWCAQHDPLTLEPVAARLKEPPSLSGAESADLLKFLMRKGPVTPAVIASVESGVDWLSKNRITRIRKLKTVEGKTDYVEDPTSSEVYWARFYDVQTGLPMFAGAQDGKVYPSFREMAQHNKVAYDYYTTKPADVVGAEVERWKKRIAKERP